MAVRFRRFGDRADLDQVVAAARGAVTRMPVDHPDRAPALSLLGAALALRFDVRGDLVDLGEAAAAARTALPVGVVLRFASTGQNRGSLLGWAGRSYRRALAAGVRTAWALPAGERSPTVDQEPAGGGLRWSGRNMRGADLTGQDLHGADLERADLTGARLTGVNLHGANLAGATLTGARLDDASLVEAALSGADLSGAWLPGADLTGTDLTAAILRRAVLLDARVSEQTLARAASTMGAALVRTVRPEPTMRNRHIPTCGAAFPSTADLLATCTDGGAVRIWDTVTGTLLRQWGRPSRSSRTCGPGRHLATIPPRDWEESEWITLTAMVLAADGCTAAILTASQGVEDAAVDVQLSSLEVRHVPSGRRIWQQPSEPDSESLFDGPFQSEEPLRIAVVLSTDGRWLAATCRGLWMAVCATATGLGWRWSGDVDDFLGHHVAFSPDGRLLAVACEVSHDTGAVVRLFDVASGEPRWRRHAGTGEVVAMAFAADGRLVTVTAAAGHWLLWVWDPDSDEPVEPSPAEGRVHLAVLSSDRRYVAAVVARRGDTDPAIELRDVDTGQLRWTTTAGSGKVTTLQFSPDGRRLIVAAEAMSLLDTATGDALWGRPLPEDADARPAVFSPDGRQIVTVGGQVRFWDAGSGELLQNLDAKHPDRPEWQVAGLCPVPAGTLDAYLPAPDEAEEEEDWDHDEDGDWDHEDDEEDS
jgi:WD40 repeat protein